jgi:hypothetical protein
MICSQCGSVMELLRNELFTDCSSPAISSNAIIIETTSTVDRSQCVEGSGSVQGSEKERKKEVFRCPKCGHEADRFIGRH